MVFFAHRKNTILNYFLKYAEKKNSESPFFMVFKDIAKTFLLCAKRKSKVFHDRIY